MPRKDFLTIGIVLLIMGFFFFFLAGSIDYDIATQTVSVVNIADSNYAYPYEFGTLSEIVLQPYNFAMQPNDYLTVKYPPYVPTNGTVYITLWEGHTNPPNTLIKYSDNGFLDFRSEQDSQIVVRANLDAENPENVLTTTVTLHHYLKPNWLFFGVGMALSSLSLIPIFKSKK